jgi:hypothetical protein
MTLNSNVKIKIWSLHRTCPSLIKLTLGLADASLFEGGNFLSTNMMHTALEETFPRLCACATCSSVMVDLEPPLRLYLLNKRLLLERGRPESRLAPHFALSNFIALDTAFFRVT